MKGVRTRRMDKGRMKRRDDGRVLIIGNSDCIAHSQLTCDWIIGYREFQWECIEYNEIKMANVDLIHKYRQAS